MAEEFVARAERVNDDSVDASELADIVTEACSARKRER
jgi:hypothetical protein